MANATNNAAVETVNPVVTTNNSDKEQRETLVVTPETMQWLSKAFGIQDDYENESRFALAFAELAVKQALKSAISQTIARFDREVEKYSKAHPAVDRNSCENMILSSKKNRGLKKMRDLAVEARKTL